MRELYHHITGGYRSTPRFFLARFIGVPTLFVLEVLYMLYLTINFLGMFLHIVAVWEGLQYPEAYRTGQAVCTDRANWVCHAGEETESILFQYWTSVYWRVAARAMMDGMSLGLCGVASEMGCRGGQRLCNHDRPGLPGLCLSHVRL